MGFRYESSKRKGKKAVQKASAIGMIMVFVILAVSVWVGWWLPNNINVRQYVPIPANWSNLTISIVAGLAAFILLQFFYVLLSGILFPLPPKDKFDEDGMYKRD